MIVIISICICSLLLQSIMQTMNQKLKCSTEGRIIRRATVPSQFRTNMYLHFLTAAAARCAVKLMCRAILLAPEWVGSVFYQARPVRRDLWKYTHTKVRIYCSGVPSNGYPYISASSSTNRVHSEEKSYKVKADITFWVV